MGISVILPAFNEEQNLRVLLPKLKKIIEELTSDYEFIVVDALESTDDAESVCVQHNARYLRQKTEGYGNAFRDGIGACNFENVLVVDTDNSQDISKIPEMYNEMQKGAHIVIGSRYTEGGNTKDPILSVIMSKCLNLCFRLVLGFKQKDISTDFRFYNRDMLKSINPVCKNFDIIEETLFLLIKKYPNIDIREIPIDYQKRLEGISKRNLPLFIMDYIKLLFKLIKIKKGE